jgi:hypothetical protein
VTGIIPSIFEQIWNLIRYFTLAGGVPANRIAAWDGSTWSALGSGFLDPIRVLTVFDNS